MKKIKFILSFCILSFCGLQLNAQDIFIKISSPGTVIEGESLVRGHEKEINVTSFGQEGSSCDMASGGAGQGNCKVTTSSFAFDMNISTAIIGLRRALYKGTHLAKVEISFNRRGANPVEYYKIVLADVLVSKITDATNGTTNVNQVQFSASKFFWTYIPQTATGAPGTPVSFGWDSQNNIEWNGN